MISSFVIIPIFAMFCYLIMMLAFLAAKKTKLINSFLFLLLIFVFWTLGSFGMRQHLFPSEKFWFYVSIDGLFFLVFAFYNFMEAFTDKKNAAHWWMWLVGSILIIAVNHLTDGFFVPAPVIVSKGGREVFAYNMGWGVIVPIVFVGCGIVDCFCGLHSYSRHDELARKQLMPIYVGITVLFLGNIATALPLFRGFPIDILSGVVNAIMMFFALYRRRLFKLTLLVSRNICYVFAGLFALLLFSNVVNGLEAFIQKNMSSMAEHSVLLVAVIFTLSTAILYAILKKFVDSVFIKEEIQQADSLKEFSDRITHTLDVDEILKYLIETIKNFAGSERIYVCVKDFEGGGYQVQQSSSPLDERSLVLRGDNPMIQWMSGRRKCLMIKDFKKTSAFKAMWEREKAQLEELHLECILPLVDEEELVGIVLLSRKVRSIPYTYDDLSYLESLASVSSVAVKNSRMYKKAYLEARTDELTGLLNRKYFYEVLQEQYEATRPKELSLLIINIDDFKLFNQLYGTDEGDQALQNVASIIAGTVGENGQVARYGGKEFAVILPGYDVLSTKNLAEVIRNQVMNMNRREADYAMKMLTVSCGICAIPTAAADINQLVSNADMAVYNAKRSGKNCTILYSEGILGISRGEGEIVSGFSPNAYNEYAATVYALTAAIDAKDHYTFSHSQNVSYYATEIARAYGMNADCVEIAKEAGLLHDIGKIGISEAVLQKPGRLTKEEYEIMKGHVEQAIGIIRHLPSLDYVIPAVIGHHERYDGRGYPRGLSGESIPLLARVLCVADSFDAMVSKRSYKDAFDVDYALKELEANSGTQFDPVLAKLFVELVKNHVVDVRTQTVK